MTTHIVAEKKCRNCQLWKLLDEFYRHRATRDGRQSYCRECKNQQLRERRKHKGESYRREAASKRYRRYGMTLEVYDTLCKAHAGVCAICRQPPNSRGLEVDHDHATGRIRGLLCHTCNVALGLFQDNILYLTRAKEYLQATPHE